MMHMCPHGKASFVLMEYDVHKELIGDAPDFVEVLRMDDGFEIDFDAVANTLQVLVSQ